MIAELRPATRSQEIANSAAPRQIAALDMCAPQPLMYNALTPVTLMKSAISWAKNAPILTSAASQPAWKFLQTLT